MQFFLRLTLCFLLLFPQHLPAQTTDSLARAIDSNARSIDQSAKDIQRWKDSLEKDRIYRNLEQHGQSLDDFLQEMREQEEKRERQAAIRIGLGVLFLVVVIVGLVRRRRK
ncbi:MAG TPA: hypothetical protein VGN63_17945 [Flavisolibacter sp.]|jgi:Flp pilus assembly protein TadB|nr:hypothetical protein [Flavisolibacter sp.]